MENGLFEVAQQNQIVRYRFWSKIFKFLLYFPYMNQASFCMIFKSTFLRDY